MTAVTDARTDTAIDLLNPDADSRAQRRQQARHSLGMRDSSEAPSLGPILQANALTMYPVFALGLLGIVDTFQSYAFTVLTPEISRSLGLSLASIAVARTLAFLATILAPLPMAALAQTRGRRAVLCLATALIWSLITLTTGFVASLVALIFVLVFDGLSTGSVSSLHAPLVTDSYPPVIRVRVLSAYQGIVTIGQVVSPLLVALLAGPLGFTWRGVFLLLGLISVGSTLSALGLKDPGPGRFDTEAIRHREHDALAEPGSSLGDDEVELGFFEIFRRLLLIDTVKRLCAGFFVLGILLIPYATFLSQFLEQRWGLTAGGRGLFFAGISVAGIFGLIVFGQRGERAFRRDPAKLVNIAGIALVIAVLMICVGALIPVFAGMCLFFAAGQALITVLTPGLSAALLSIVDARYRPHAAAVTGIFTAAGSLLGTLFLAGIYDRYGDTGTIVSLVVPGVAAALIIRSAKDLIDADLDRMIDEVLDEEDVRVLRESGVRLPMLSARGVNFSYGQLQVLFDVSFTVDEGEMVALLGTNGAGKSTLLKVISGIGLPSKGSVRFRGQEITYLDAERRVPLGITQIPGGRAVFGTMDVVENLRSFGYTLGRNRSAVEESIELCFEAFPRLRERQSSLAGNLSGGEQQMVGLAKALILRPRLLLIDELSLGLAPVIVGPLLDMVRSINAAGTAVVLVEQSVNIALSLVEHAYFMEKGEMRFDGPAADLLARDDLLRAVFLEGAGEAQPAVVKASPSPRRRAPRAKASTVDREV